MVLLVTPNTKKINYGLTSNEFSAVQPNIYMHLLEAAYNSRGIETTSIHMEADGVDLDTLIGEIRLMNPMEVGIISSGSNPSASTMTMVGTIEICKRIKREIPNQKVFVWGGHPTVMPERTKIETGADRVVIGTDFGMEPAFIPTIDWKKINPKKYKAHNWHCFGNLDDRTPYAAIWTTLGCPYQCFRGDTFVNTIYGKKTFKDLYENYKTIPVYTYDLKTNEVLIKDAIEINKYGINKELVRVLFDDGSHIDCTPDHKFICFNQANQFVKQEHFEVQAKDLIPGQSVRALKTGMSGRKNNQYLEIQWMRKKRQKVHRLVAEYKIGRKINSLEQVHHIDKNKLNNTPDNLVVLSRKDHQSFHPEISERMKLNNPIKNITKEWKAKIRNSLLGKKRTDNQKLKYRLSKLKEKNPNWKGGISNRLSQINHKVVSVTKLEEKDDVYCLTVPEYGVFFVNDVLVHNCEFCCINNVFEKRVYKMRHMQDVLAEIDILVGLGVRNIKIMDELFVSNNHKRLIEFCDGIKERKYKLNMWAFARTDTVTPSILDILKEAGINWLAYGFESIHQNMVTDQHKGSKVKDYEKVIKWTKDAGISIIADFIAGFLNDTPQTLKETYDFMCAQNFEFINLYPLFAYPGTPLYEKYIANGIIKEPTNWAEYSLYGVDCKPCPTREMSSKEVLQWRDEHYVAYYKRLDYLNMIKNKFGNETSAHIIKMSDMKLERNICQ